MYGSFSGRYKPPSGARPPATAALKPTGAHCPRVEMNFMVMGSPQRRKGREDK